MTDVQLVPAEAERPPEVVRNNEEVEALIRSFEEMHKAHEATEPKHRDEVAYHRARAAFVRDLQDAVRRQHAPPPPEKDDGEEAAA